MEAIDYPSRGVNKTFIRMVIGIQSLKDSSQSFHSLQAWIKGYVALLPRESPMVVGAPVGYNNTIQSLMICESYTHAKNDTAGLILQLMTIILDG